MYQLATAEGSGRPPGRQLAPRRRGDQPHRVSIYYDGRLRTSKPNSDPILYRGAELWAGRDARRRPRVSGRPGRRAHLHPRPLADGDPSNWPARRRSIRCGRASADRACPVPAGRRTLAILLMALGRPPVKAIDPASWICCSWSTAAGRPRRSSGRWARPCPRCWPTWRRAPGGMPSTNIGVISADMGAGPMPMGSSAAPPATAGRSRSVRIAGWIRRNGNGSSHRRAAAAEFHRDGGRDGGLPGATGGRRLWLRAAPAVSMAAALRPDPATRRTAASCAGARCWPW